MCKLPHPVFFHGVKFSLSGPSTIIYHRVHITAMSTEGLCVLVARTFIVKSVRQLLERYSYVRERHGR